MYMEWMARGDTICKNYTVTYDEQVLQYANFRSFTLKAA